MKQVIKNMVPAYNAPINIEQAVPYTYSGFHNEEDDCK